MIFNNPSAFGLDLSDLSVKLVWLKRVGSQIHLASFGRQEIPEKIIESGNIRKEEELIILIKSIISQAKGEKVKTKYCIVSLPETEAYLRIVQLPKMKKEEVGEAIRWELEAYIPVSIDTVYFDWQIIDSGVGQTEHLDVLIGALPKALVDPYLEVIKKAGLEPLAFEIESVATARALIKENGFSDPVLMIDLGARRTSFIIFVAKTVWLTTSPPISNNLLIDDIAKGLKITYAEAKNLKFKVGLDRDKEKGQVYQAMEPRLLELVAEIKKYLDYYKTSYLPKRAEKSDIKKILLCGGGANLKGLSAFLSSKLGLEVAVGNPWVNILSPSADELPGLPFEESLSYATALGLALRGIEK